MLTLIISIILVTEIFSLFIDYLNYKHWTPKIPKQLEGFVDETKYKKAQEYNKTVQRFEFITSIFGTGIMIFALTSGLFGKLDNYVATNITHNDILITLIFFALCYLIYDLLMLPFTVYDTFVIEERFGFNKTTVKTFILDKLKGYLLTAIIGGIVLYLFKLFYDFAGELFLLYAWITVTIISIFFSTFYTSLIVPIFNKLKPLKQGELRTEIETYAKKVKFPLDKVLVMDASKRSSKGNAFFNGLFGKKNIVLYDTIVDKYPKEGLVAVLAHEVGHFQKKHILKQMVLSTIITGVMLYFLGLFINNPVFSEALGSDMPKFHLGLIAFGLIYTPISMLIGVLSNMLSRKFEFEADNFAKVTYSAKDLVQSLKNLYIDNLSNLNPHPVYVFVNYSHPPVLERIKKLMS